VWYVVKGISALEQNVSIGSEKHGGMHPSDKNRLLLTVFWAPLGG